MHWSLLMTLILVSVEATRGIVNTIGIVWLQEIMNQPFFTHIGNIDNVFYVTASSSVIINVFNVEKTKVSYALLALAVIAGVYLHLDAEINFLPLVNQGTPDPLDIPAGFLGTVLGICYVRHRIWTVANQT